MGLKVDLETRTHLHAAFVIYPPKPEWNPIKSIIKSTANNADSDMKLGANTWLQMHT